MNIAMTLIHHLEEYRGNTIYIKRDDFYPISFGGNKARKAINFFREIDAGGYDCIVTYGSSSSNHCRVVSNMAAMRGIECHIISPLEASDPTFNSQMMKLFGVKLTVVPVESVHETIEEKLHHLKMQGRNPYFIAGGGHGNLGTQAYVDCYEEICRYEKDNKLFFNYIFLASGTGTTQAGLVCGQLQHRDERHIVGISIARKNPRGRQVILDSIYEYLTAKNIQIDGVNIEKATEFDDSYTKEGYGKQHVLVQKMIKDMLIAYGVPMDSTYTGKAYLGMREYIQKNYLTGENILFLHTGGTPLFFDDLKRMVMTWQ